MKASAISYQLSAFSFKALRKLSAISRQLFSFKALLLLGCSIVFLSSLWLIAES